MTIDRGGVYPLRYEKHEKTILVVQRKRDTQQIPQRWYWRLLTSEEAGGGAPYDEYFEQPVVSRNWAQPVGVHLYIDDSSETKGRKKGYTEAAGVVNVEMSRAEARRLGGVFNTKDDKDFIRDDSKEQGGPWAPQDYIFIPRSGDLFMFKSKLFEIQQMNDPKVLGPTQIPVVYVGTAHQFLNDSTEPAELRDLFMPETSTPPQDIPSIRFSS